MAEERPGFLGRWARRKTEVLQGKPLDEPAAVEKSAPAGELAASPVPVKATPVVAPASAINPVEEPEKMLSLDDVKLLSRDSDFSPFMARGVGPEVRNAAMKKLFTDPRYNVMDGLDTYIDDYSKSDPIPESMLRQMVGAKLLKIFDEEEDDEIAGKEGDATQPPLPALPPDGLNNPMPVTAAQSGHCPATQSPIAIIVGVGNEPSGHGEPSSGKGPAKPYAAHG